MHDNYYVPNKDITRFITQFVNMMINEIKYTFDVLDGIKFMGFSLLDFALMTMIIAIIIPIIFTIAKNSVNRAERSIK